MCVCVRALPRPGYPHPTNEPTQRGVDKESRHLGRWAYAAMAIRAAVMSGDPPRRTRLALAHAGEVLGRARRMRQPRESTGCPATTVQVDAEQPPPIAAEDASESCVVCMSRPRAVRFLPCRHAVMYELCTIETMQRSGQSVPIAEPPWRGLSSCQ